PSPEELVAMRLKPFGPDTGSQIDMRKFQWSRCAVLGAAALGLAMTATPVTVSYAQDADAPLVVFLLPENVTARWESQDKPFFIAAMEKEYPGAQVKVENALNDTAKQLRSEEHTSELQSRENLV